MAKKAVRRLGVPACTQKEFKEYKENGGAINNLLGGNKKEGENSQSPEAPDGAGNEGE